MTVLLDRDELCDQGGKLVALAPDEGPKQLICPGVGALEYHAPLTAGMHPATRGADAPVPRRTGHACHRDERRKSQVLGKGVLEGK
jgi:hypothetical protein